MNYTCRVPLSLEVSKQEYRSGLPFPPPGNLPNPGIEPVSLASPALAGRFFATEIYFNISVLSIHRKDWCWNWNSNTLATPFEELTHWKRPWCWERLKAGGEGDDRGWDGWMASPTRWAWAGASSRSWWWTERPGMLQFMGLQRVGHDWATELTDQKVQLGFSVTS